MKRIKQIIEALKVLSRTPSKTISKAVKEVMSAARAKVESEGIDAYASEEDLLLVGNLLDAVVAIAEDMEKPAKAEGEAAK